MITQDELRRALHYDPKTGYIGMIRTYTPPDEVTYIDGQMYLNIGGVYPVRKLIWLYMTGEWPTGRIYTCSSDPGETRWDWLVDDKSAKPVKLSNRSKSGHTGISQATTGCWTVNLRIKGRSIYLGSFKTLDEAVAAKAHAELTMKPRMFL